jgi:hypothetical protein
VVGSRYLASANDDCDRGRTVWPARAVYQDEELSGAELKVLVPPRVGADVAACERARARVGWGASAAPGRASCRPRRSTRDRYAA